MRIVYHSTVNGKPSPRRKRRKKQRIWQYKCKPAYPSIPFDPKQGKQKHCAMNQTNRPSASRTPSFSPLLEGRHMCMMWVMGDACEHRRTGPKKPLILTPVIMRRFDSRQGHQAQVEVEGYYGTEGQAEGIEREMRV